MAIDITFTSYLVGESYRGPSRVKDLIEDLTIAGIEPTIK